MISFPKTLTTVLFELNNQGTAYLVGGAVRDYFLDLTPKDYDFEIFGYTCNQFEDFLKSHSLPYKLVGKDFGIYIVTIDNIDYEFALPRIERSIGINHKDFEITIVPNLSLKEAQGRRDFTINAIYYNTQNNLFYDFFNGILDIKNKILKATNKDTFIEDPLRVLRAMRFLSKYNFIASVELISICQTIKSEEILSLSSERRYEEFLKWAETNYPHIGLEFLRLTNHLDCFLFLNDLSKVPQSKKWHPEGNVFIHTFQILEQLSLNNHTGNPILTIATLLHDIGKIKTTNVNETGSYINYYKPQEIDKITSYNHDIIGSEMVYEFFESLNPNYEKGIVKQISELVKYHMQVAESKKALNKLKNKLQFTNIMDLLRLQLADCWRFDKDIVENNFTLLKNLPEFKSVIDGKYLQTLGYIHSDSFNFGNIIKKAKEDQLEGILTEENKLEWLKQFI